MAVVDPTIATLFQRVAQRIGSRTGIMGTVTPVTVSGTDYFDCELLGLINTIGSNSAFQGNLVFLDSSNVFHSSLVSKWTDNTGTARVRDLGYTPVAGTQYLLLTPDDYSLNEFDIAFERTLRESKRTYRQVVPITPNRRFQSLEVCDWLQGTGQVDAVFMNVSPITLHNEDFSLWQEGATAAPDGWTLSGAGATVQRVSGGLRGPYGVRLTSGGGAAAQLRQSMPATFVQWMLHRIAAVSTPVRGAAWATSTDSNSTRIGIYDGVTTHYASSIDADGVPHFPTLTVPIVVGDAATQTEFTLVLEVAAGGHSGTFFASVLMQNTQAAENAYNLRDQGSPYYQETEVYQAPRNIGGVPTLEYESWPNTYGQIIVYSRRPFPVIAPATDGYDTTIEYQYSRNIEAGIAVFLLQNIKPQQDRARLDRLLRSETSIWKRFSENLQDLPPHDPPVQVQVGSA